MEVPQKINNRATTSSSNHTCVLCVQRKHNQRLKETPACPGSLPERLDNELTSSVTVWGSVENSENSEHLTMSVYYVLNIVLSALGI